MPKGAIAAYKTVHDVPRHQPRRSSLAVELTVPDVCQRFPDWGDRKLAWVMRDEGCLHVPNTITEILRRECPPEESKWSFLLAKTRIVWFILRARRRNSCPKRD
jgi:hypothetical protein